MFIWGGFGALVHRVYLFIFVHMYCVSLIFIYKDLKIVFLLGLEASKQTPLQTAFDPHRNFFHGSALILTSVFIPD